MTGILKKQDTLTLDDLIEQLAYYVTHLQDAPIGNVFLSKDNEVIAGSLQPAGKISFNYKEYYAFVQWLHTEVFDNTIKKPEQLLTISDVLKTLREYRLIHPQSGAWKVIAGVPETELTSEADPDNIIYRHVTGLEKYTVESGTGVDTIYGFSTEK